MAGDGKPSVLVDGLSPVTAKSEGTVVGFADVCKVPGPTGPVPIPFPNIARSGDLKNGSKSVSINGAPVCLKDSYLGTSTGNEAATAGGVGCAGVTRIPEKPDQQCPKQRRHHLTHAASGLPLSGRALKVGE